MRPGEKKYPHIFSPGKIGKMETKNRIKYASTQTNFNTRNGFVTDQEVAYLEAQARGGAGMVTTQGAYPDPTKEGRGYMGMMAIWDDKFIPGLRRIAKAIQKYDAKAVCQIIHCGRGGGLEMDHCVGPSAVPQKLALWRPPREMTKEEIQLSIQQHIDAARRAAEAGFDAVEMSSIVGYLIATFLSPYTNKRTDEYGGSLENRTRFLTEILKGIRKELGPDYPIIVRLCGEELMDEWGGNTPEECLEIIKIAEQAGMDFLSLTVGWQESPVSVITRDIPMGHWLYVAERVKKNIKVPMCMAYRLFYPDMAERAIAEGKLDFWEMCRPMIADPELPNKIAEDRQEDIIPCISCNACLIRLYREQPITCAVRPSVGHEGDPDWQIKTVEKKKKVMVIGGGPSGMQCAVVAARRGHDVTLYERRDQLGGQIPIAAHGPYGDDELQRVANYLSTQCKKSGVKVELKKDVTPSLVKEVSPDVIVVATGAEAVPPPVPGSDRDNVVSVHDVMEGKVEPGKRVVILGGRGVGIAVALFLIVKGGREICLVEEGRKLGRDVNSSYIWRYMKKLKEGKVNIFINAKVKEITDGSVILIDAKKKEVEIPADTVIAANLKSRNEMVDELKSICDELYVIGDALVPRRILNATRDGYRLGLRI